MATDLFRRRNKHTYIQLLSAYIYDRAYPSSGFFSGRLLHVFCLVEIFSCPGVEKILSFFFSIIIIGLLKSLWLQKLSCEFIIKKININNSRH